MKKIKEYGIIYYDRNVRQFYFKKFASKEEALNEINYLSLGKDFVSSIDIVEIVLSWDAYDGITRG